MNRLRIPHNAWVLVGDGEKAMVLRNEGDEVYPNLIVERLMENENPPTREQGTDRPGRYRDAPVSTSQQRSAFETTDWHRLEKERFAKDVAERLYKLAHAGRFDKLIVVAPPATLGKLRAEMHEEVSRRVVAEIDKTLTQHPVSEIERVLTSG